MPTHRIGYAILTQNQDQLPFYGSLEDALTASWVAGPEHEDPSPKVWYLTKREELREDLWGGCVGYIREKDPIGLRYDKGEFTETPVSSGRYSRFVVHLPTWTICHQITRYIPSQRFRKQLQLLLNTQADQWEIEPVHTQAQSYTDWLNTVEGITKVKATLPAPNPSFPEESDAVEWFFTDTRAERIAMRIASDNAGYLNPDSDLVSQVIAYREAVSTSEVTVEGLTRGSLLPSRLALGSEGEERTETIDTSQKELAFADLYPMITQADPDENSLGETS